VFQVFTLSFDRSSIVTAAMLKKLHHARSHAGVVVSTPSAVKSLMLRFLENLTIIRSVGLRAVPLRWGRSVTRSPALPLVGCVWFRARETDPSMSSQRKLAKFVANQRKLLEALRLIENTGTLLCDEVDMVLSPLRSELVRAQGQGRRQLLVSSRHRLASLVVRGRTSRWPRGSTWTSHRSAGTSRSSSWASSSPPTSTCATPTPSARTASRSAAITLTKNHRPGGAGNGCEL
jgi:hypothetical protein